MGDLNIELNRGIDFKESLSGFSKVKKIGVRTCGKAFMIMPEFLRRFTENQVNRRLKYHDDYKDYFNARKKRNGELNEFINERLLDIDSGKLFSKNSFKRNVLKGILIMIDKLLPIAIKENQRNTRHVIRKIKRLRRIDRRMYWAEHMKKSKNKE